MGALGLPPRRPVRAEDIRDLQGRMPHAGDLRRVQSLDRADHFAQNVGGHLCIERRGFKLLVPEQHLDHPDIHLLLQEVGGETMPPMPSSA
jgi:hypothetical protein